MYPSVPQLLVSVLQTQYPTALVCTELPSDVEQHLPAIQIRRFGGAEHVLTMDSAYIDLDVWAPTLAAADLLASQLRTWLRLHLSGRSATGPTGTGVFARVHEQTGAMQRPSGNADLYRVGLALTVYVHSA